MTYKEYIQRGGSSGFRARGSFKGATASGSSYGGASQSQGGDVKTVVVGVGKTEEGKVLAENIGREMSEEQKRSISEAVSKEGRLKVRREQESRQREIALTVRREGTRRLAEKLRKEEVEPSTKRRIVERREIAAGETLRRRYASPKPDVFVFSKPASVEEERAYKQYLEREHANEAFWKSLTLGQKSSYNFRMSLRDDLGESPYEIYYYRTPANEEEASAVRVEAGQRDKLKAFATGVQYGLKFSGQNYEGIQKIYSSVRGSSLDAASYLDAYYSRIPPPVRKPSLVRTLPTSRKGVGGAGLLGAKEEVKGWLPENVLLFGAQIAAGELLGMVGGKVVRRIAKYRTKLHYDWPESVKYLGFKAGEKRVLEFETVGGEPSPVSLEYVDFEAVAKTKTGNMYKMVGEQASIVRREWDEAMGLGERYATWQKGTVRKLSEEGVVAEDGVTTFFSGVGEVRDNILLTLGKERVFWSGKVREIRRAGFLGVQKEVETGVLNPGQFDRIYEQSGAGFIVEKVKSKGAFFGLKPVVRAEEKTFFELKEVLEKDVAEFGLATRLRFKKAWEVSEDRVRTSIFNIGGVFQSPEKKPVWDVGESRFYEGKQKAEAFTQAMVGNIYKEAGEKRVFWSGKVRQVKAEGARFMSVVQADIQVLESEPSTILRQVKAEGARFMSVVQADIQVLESEAMGLAAQKYAVQVQKAKVWSGAVGKIAKGWLIEESKLAEDVVRREEFALFKPLRLEVVPISRDVLRVEPKVELKSELRSELRSKLRSEVRQEVRQEAKQEVKQEAKQEVKQEAKQKVRQEVRQEVRQFVRAPLPHIIPTLPTRLKLKGWAGEGRGLVGYDVFVRRAGAFTKINLSPLVRKEAVQLGALTVGTTAAASFKVRQTRGVVGQRFRARGVLSDFIKGSKRLGEDVYVEKPSRRIKSLGELQGITFRGIKMRWKK